MKTATINLIILRSARILTILYAGLLSIFSFDVFESKESVWRILLAFLLHLIPTWIILLTLWISWKRAWVGAIIFFLLACAYIIIAWGKFRWPAYCLIAGPLFIMSLLYFISWKNRNKN